MDFSAFVRFFQKKIVYVSIIKNVSTSRKCPLICVLLYWYTDNYDVFNTFGHRSFLLPLKDISGQQQQRFDTVIEKLNV